MSNSEGSRSLLDYLPAALAVITGLLGAVGGLTGGIARMMRNNPGAALATLLAGLAAIILALVAQGLRRRPRWARGLVLVATACFAGAMVSGIWLAVDTARVTDRPSLQARVIQGAGEVWTLTGSASASGLPASGSIQVYIYAIPEDEDAARTQLFFVTAGPNSEGVVEQRFSVPLPSPGDFDSFVVTAALGDEVRYCDGTALRVSARLNTTTLEDRDIGRNACLTLRPPPAAD